MILKMREVKLLLVFSTVFIMLLWGGAITAQKKLSPSTVGGTFGAGESSVIKPGIHNDVNRVNEPWNIYYPQTFSVPTGIGVIEYSPIGIGLNSYRYSNKNIGISDITLGGADSNIVIKNYSANGYGIGWISVLNRHVVGNSGKDASGHDLDDWNYYKVEIKPEVRYNDPLNIVHNRLLNPEMKITKNGELTEYSFNKFNIYDFEVQDWYYDSDNKPYSVCGQPVFTVLSPDDLPNGGIKMTIHQHNEQKKWEQNEGKLDLYIESYPIEKPNSSYTSTIDSQFVQSYLPGYFNKMEHIGKTDAALYTNVNLSIDDDIPLVQFNGPYMKDGGALNTQKGLKSDKENPAGNLTTGIPFNYYYNKDDDKGNLANYKRPTTIILQADGNTGHEFSKIDILDIGWKYEYNKADTSSHDGTFLGSCNAGTAMGYQIEIGRASCRERV